MFIKQFREQLVRVPDPLRPGKRVFETRLNPSGAHAVSHGSEVYEGDDEGWIEVPDEVGQPLRNFRGAKGEKFYTPEEVDEEIVAGRIKPEPEPEPAPRGPVRVDPPKAEKAKADDAEED